MTYKEPILTSFGKPFGRYEYNGFSVYMTPEDKDISDAHKEYKSKNGKLETPALDIDNEWKDNWIPSHLVIDCVIGEV